MWDKRLAVLFTSGHWQLIVVTSWSEDISKCLCSMTKEESELDECHDKSIILRPLGQDAGKQLPRLFATDASH